jgi:hypothetical protein
VIILNHANSEQYFSELGGRIQVKISDAHYSLRGIPIFPGTEFVHKGVHLFLISR